MVALPDDTAFVERLRSDGAEQAAALEQLRLYLLRGVQGTYAKKGMDASFSEDVVQEALVKILGKLDQFEGKSKFTTWAMTIAIREAVSRFRRKHFQDVSLEQVAGEDSLRIDVPANTQSPDANAEREQVVSKLHELIEQQLSQRQREAIQALLGGMPVEEIAARTESNRNAVYKLIHDGRKRLKQGLEAAGYGWSEIQAAMSI